MNDNKLNMPSDGPRKVKPLLLLVLDGWGYSEDPQCNAIFSANKPNWDYLWNHYAHTLIEGSGMQVGLPDRQMGNSEVGHLNLGAGRLVYQEFTRIDKAIAEDKFRHNSVLLDTVHQAVAADKAVHILGLLSPGGVHSHENQIQAMVELAVEQGARKLFLHAFLDGRDTPPKSATDSLTQMSELFSRLGVGRLASIIGRYFAMDRDNRWPRIKAAYDLICHGQSEFQASDAVTAIEQAYERGETDEFVKATAISPAGEQAVQIADGDVVIFMNFRADRARQLSQAFVEEDFCGFDRGKRPQLGNFISLTEYKKDLNIPVAYPPAKLHNVFAEVISKLGLHQLRVAETEKYAHVTFFFNGGEEQPFAGEERILIPSPNVSTYDEQPEMSAVAVTDTLLAAIDEGRFDVIICNYANPDMVGHTGNFEAAVKAIEAIDACLGRLYESVTQAGGEMLITADHGNAEQMCDPATGQPHTAHTTNPVPLIYVGRQADMRKGGALSDVAPTMLMLMGLETPPEMKGKTLVSLGKT